ncbi:MULTISPECIES: flagellin N-terminal helical domain-containing protein [unclassified Candidatus Frackibacter]|uniref:flagellin N-terminal helical domain-containing protein n=1 Tax=unclassified Candidatus Frackibacter TaxID=2648818 RepID=UPI0007990A4A|nr:MULTISPECIES: flagellin [unclassified Candidatus Frackibacter]KXS41260.1 MAG: flagellin [Candidatus Frackibacter sp. T328-2]SDC72617.1 flagellin [Candidatus Frackibacter sp. WG11]SEM86878.1 flagellin [Candidatus Frackibacter sp. WG12]SFL95930.1 flagellin [Candidatus Frackibacter sp. WG13]
MRINTNVAALNSYNQLKTTQSNMSKSLERLSSGKRINRAADDAAGLAISEKMKAQINGLAQAQRNAQDGISMIQTAEGALKETHSILQRMRELSVQAANDTNTNADRFEIQKEVNKLTEELTRIGNNTEFNTQKLLDGSLKAAKFQIGSNEGQNISLKINDMRAESLSVTADSSVSTFDAGTTNMAASGNSTTNLQGGAYSVSVTDSGGADLKAADGTVIASGALASGGTSVTFSGINGDSYTADDTTSGSVTIAISDAATSGISTDAGNISINVLEKGEGISVMNQADADDAITTIDNAISRVSAERSKLGAYQNRLDHTINNLSTSKENLTAANSRIRDVDMAKEMMNLSKQRILSQAGTAMLAQANQRPQGVLQLLG